MEKPLVSIIIVNFNGKDLLKDCLKAVFKSSYPKKNFEVILVDNDSHDESVKFVHHYFPSVQVIENLDNQGFAGGSNSGFKHAKGDYIVLLNSDVRVDINWLQELVLAARQKSVGIVCSKLYFDIPFIELKITSGIEILPDVQKGIDGFSPLGILIEDIVCDSKQKSNLVWYMNGFYRKNEGKISSRWTNGNANVLLPFAQNVENYSISIHGIPETIHKETPIKVYLNDILLLKDVIRPKQVKPLNIRISKSQASANFHWLIQNAGNVIFANGLSRDRGSVIRRDESETKEFYDFDSEYYNVPKKLLAACGASCLIKREVIDKVGLFDDAYFMYYEDIDLSLRTWRANWDILYAPKSIAYHKHRVTTNKQDSIFMIRMLEKNRLYLLLTHFPLHIFAYEFIFFLSRLLFTLAMTKLFQFTAYYSEYQFMLSEKAKGRKQAFIEFRKNFKRLLWSRFYQNKMMVRNINELVKYLY